MLLSIIIPVFNQEKLILRALDSIPKRADVETIIVDDCSKDNTYDVINKYQRTHTNIKVFHNEYNEGPGFSRNIGIDNANGKYIMFLDSDDYFIDDAYSSIEKILEYDNYDMIFYNLVENNGHVIDITKDNPRACGTIKILRREFVGKLRFPLIRKSEDRYFHNWLMNMEPNIYHSHVSLVHYDYPRIGSITAEYKNTDFNVKDVENYKYLVEATKTYEEREIKDITLNRVPNIGEQWYVNKNRLDYLMWKAEKTKDFPYVYLIRREKETSVLVKATNKYIKNNINDKELGRKPNNGETWYTNEVRASMLSKNGYVEVIE